MSPHQNSSIRRETAYTTPRPDVFAMVPSMAMSILDVGCSNGALGASLRIAKPGCSVVGIEIDPIFASEAKDRLDKVICANLNDFDWSASMNNMRFDCIIFADVLEHLVDPSRHLLEAQRFLNSGGCIVISLPNIRHISALCSIFVKGTFPKRDRGIFDKTHLRWFTIKDANMLIADAGMTVEESSYVLRIGDKGGGIVNRVLGKLFRPIQTLFPVREFLTYQFCLRATVHK